MSDKTIKTVLNLVKIALMLIGVINTILIIKGSGVDESGMVVPNEGQISFGLSLGNYLMYICMFAMAIFAVYHVVFNLKKSIPTLIGVAIFAVIALISYSMSSDEMLESWKYKDPQYFTPSNAKWSDAGLIVMYFFGFITILAIVVGELWGVMKRFSK